jgi:hypothetical protein
MVFAPLSRQLERGRKRLFDRGICGWKSWENPTEQGFDLIGIETDSTANSTMPRVGRRCTPVRAGAMLAIKQRARIR